MPVGRRGSCLLSDAPASTSSRSASAATCSAGRPTRPSRFEVLDAYVAAGGNFIDTANSYLVEHGRSETIIGRWMAERGNRDELVIATKVGGGSGAVRSLQRGRRSSARRRPRSKRLQTDRIDLYYAHFDDEDTPLEETLRAFDALVQAGTVRHDRGLELLAGAARRRRSSSSASTGLAVFTVLQPHYNLVERDFERTLLPVADAWDLAVLPVLRAREGLPHRQVPAGRRGRRLPAGRGARAPTSTSAARPCSRRSTRSPARTTCPVAAVALAWLLAHPRVVAPIASARTVEQLEQILPAATLELTAAELDRLSATTR